MAGNSEQRLLSCGTLLPSSPHWQRPEFWGVYASLSQCVCQWLVLHLGAVTASVSCPRDIRDHVWKCHQPQDRESRRPQAHRVDHVRGWREWRGSSICCVTAKCLVEVEQRAQTDWSSIGVAAASDALMRTVWAVASAWQTVVFMQRSFKMAVKSHILTPIHLFSIQSTVTVK